MFKGTNRFSQKLASGNRPLSGYSKTRKLKAMQIPQSSEFERGTAYVKKLTPLMRQLVADGLSPSDIADDLEKRRVSSPSGSRWSAARLSELLAVVKIRKTHRSAASTRRPNQPQSALREVVGSAPDEKDVESWRRAATIARKALAKAKAKRELGLKTAAITAAGGPSAAEFRKARRWR